MGRKAALHNLGCKVNAYELEAMQQQLEAAGYEIVPFAPGADVYVINTCTVTNIADRKSRQMLHRARKMNPDAVVIAAGCAARTREKDLQVDPAIDLVLPNEQKDDLVEVLAAYLESHAVPDTALPEQWTYDHLSVSHIENSTRAFIKVQDGCNQFCSYCIIPFARGRIRSRSPESVAEECRRLAAGGVREIVLTGIHLSSYGRDREEQMGLLDLIRVVHAIDGVERIRLGSLEPGIITEEFAEALAGMRKFCPHFHLSLQSGCNRTLQRMNRHYTAEEYREKCSILRKYFRRPALTTDVITGFPGETEEDFEACRAFVEEISFYETHIFPYSRREGTRAAAFPDQLTEKVKKSRGQVLGRIHEEKKHAFLTSFLSEEAEVLFEEQEEIGGRLCWTGYTREYIRTAAVSEEDLRGCICRVRLEGFLTDEVLKVAILP